MFRLFDIPVHLTSAGKLSAVESGAEIPFLIRRVYYIYEVTKESARGFHAHRDLEQVVVCVSGGCDFIVDDGYTRQSFVLDRPDKALYLPSMTWREMHNFSKDAVLLVLASHVYDENDYIHDYADFEALVT